jgi:hypothetical protein
MCDCCGKAEGTVRETETRTSGTWGPDKVRKRLPTKTLCDTCNDNEPAFPFYDEGGIRTCPHDVA